MQELLNVISNQKWVFDELKEALPHVNVEHSYGWDIKRFTGHESFWVPTALAARLIYKDPTLGFISPGAHWYKNISSEFLQRDFELIDYQDFHTNYKIPETGIWCKPADMKLDFFEPVIHRSQQAFESYLDNNPRQKEYLHKKSKILVTTGIMDFIAEYRFYVKSDDISNGSCYLKNGNDYYSEIDLTDSVEHAEAWNFAQEVIKRNENLPETFVLDVGFDKTTNNWLVIELNPVWSSAFYGNDLKFVYECLKLAIIDPTLDKSPFIWQPDPYLRKKAEANYSVLNFIEIE